MAPAMVVRFSREELSMKRCLVALLMALFAEAAFGQVTYVPTVLAFPQIAIGGDPNGVNYTTVVQMVNNNSSSLTEHIALYSDTGAPMAASFDGGAPVTALDLSLVSGQTRELHITMNGAVTPGSMQVTYWPSDAVTSVIVQFFNGPSLLSEVGIPPTFTDNIISGADFAAVTGPGLNTGIALANPSTDPEYVLARLWDPTTGTSYTSSIITLAPNGHKSELLNEMFPGVLNITQLSAQISLDSCASSSCSFAGGNGFAAAAVRLNGDQYTTIPINDRNADSNYNPVRFLPQVAFGGPAGGVNMTTILYFTTDIASGVFGTAQIFDDNGNPLSASVNGAAPSSSFTFTVPGDRVSAITLTGDSVLRSGWIQLNTSTNVHLVTNALFQTFNGPNLASEASVLDSAAIQNGLVYVETQQGAADVGIALANTQATPNAIKLDLFNTDGFLAESQTITVAPFGHQAHYISEIFPDVASGNFSGSLSIHSPVAFSAIALRLTGTKVATLEVSNNGMYRPAITNLRITKTVRSPAQISFSIDVTDVDSDLATAASSSVLATGYVDFGSAGFDYGPVTIDGTSVIGHTNGTINGVFQPPDVTGAVPGGTPAVFYIVISDSLGNVSNLVGLPFKF
jgi:hypothetical protein